MLYEIEEYEEARESYNEVAKKFSTNYGIFKAIGDCFRKEENYKKAIENYKKSIDLWEEDEDASKADKAIILNSRALLYKQDHRTKLAEQDFNELIQIDKKNPLFLCNRANFYNEINQNEKAKKDLENAKKLLKLPHTKLSKSNIEFIEKKISLYETMIKTEEQIDTMDKDDPEVKKVIEYYIKFKKNKEDHEHNSHNCSEEEVDKLHEEVEYLKSQL